jgi:thioesterase domain-containing protein
MREIAEDFADQLAPFVGRPFHLFGLCWGAAAAFEVAAVLEARGTPPASVGLLDPTALGVQIGADGRSRTGGRVGFVLDRLSVYWDEFQTLDWAGRREMVSTKTSRVADAIRGRTPEETRQEMRTRAVVEANLRALVDYQPTSVATPARLFLAKDHDPGDRRDHRLEWLDYFDPVASRVIVPGFDSGDVINTHTEALAEALDRWLDEVEDGR